MAQQVETQAKAKVQVIDTLCHLCHNFCGVKVHVEDGKVAKIVGNKEITQNRGQVCTKSSYSQYSMYAPTRPLYPMKRVGERGEGKWQRISWDEAIDLCADKFQEIREKYGPEAIAGIIGSQYRSHGMSTNRFLRTLGSPNIMCDDYICEGMQGIADDATVGEHITKYRYSADFENSKAIFALGANLAVTYNPKWKNIIPRARAKGAKLIVVDTRLTETAEKADLFVQVRPGTDGALLLSLMNVIIEEGLYDQEFVEKWTHGFDRLAEHVQQYSPERVAEITDVSADRIRELARFLGHNRPVSFHVGLGIHQYSNSTQTCRAAICLLAILGSVDIPGGNILLKGKSYPGYVGFWDIWSDPAHRLSREIEERRIGAKEHPLWSGPDSLMHCATVKDVWRAMLTGDPYPVKGFWVTSTNILATHPEPKYIYEALKSLDFLVVVEFMQSPVADMADVLLPTTMWLEESGADIIVAPGERQMAVRQPVTEAMGEARDTGEMQIDIVRRMVEKGYISQEAVDRYLPWKDRNDFLAWRLAKTGVSYEELKEKGYVNCPPSQFRTYEDGGFHTPTGKVELYSTIFEKVGYPALPTYVETLENRRTRPDLAKRYPLSLSTGQRVYEFQHSRYIDIQQLHRVHPDPIVEISPQAAAERGIKDGDWCRVETRYGSGKFRARIRESHPEFVSVTHAWWFPEETGHLRGIFESSGNNLISYEPCDPISTTPLAKGTLCEVVKL